MRTATSEMGAVLLAAGGSALADTVTIPSLAKTCAAPARSLHALVTAAGSLP